MTNPAYEATNSDVEKLIADMKDSAEKATPGEWHLSNEHKLIIRDEDHLHIANAGYFDNPVEVADAKHIALANPKNVLALIAALEQAHQENKEQSARIEELESQRQLAFMACNRWRDKCADAEKRIAELESAPNGVMQLSNELAEMKRKCEELQEQKDKWSAWAISLGAKADELESRPLCVKSNDAMREAAPLCVKLPAAATDVLAERHRQITSEGWTPEHDDEHVDGQIAEAAAAYAYYAHDPSYDIAPSMWPWVATAWKHTNPRRDLVKAGALIIAEIERIDRAAGGTV